MTIIIGTAVITAILSIFGILCFYLEFRDPTYSSTKAENARYLRYSLLALITSPIAILWLPVVIVIMLGVVLFRAMPSVKQGFSSFSCAVQSFWSAVWYKETV